MQIIARSQLVGNVAKFTLGAVPCGDLDCKSGK